jgi:hypothetical protein
LHLVRPDNGTLDLGLMADGTVIGATYTWTMAVLGSHLTKVGAGAGCQLCVRRRTCAWVM